MDKVIKDASPNWGGKRPGAGSKKKGGPPKKSVCFWITDDEKKTLQETLKKIREE